MTEEAVETAVWEHFNATFNGAPAIEKHPMRDEVRGWWLAYGVDLASCEGWPARTLGELRKSMRLSRLGLE